MPPKSNRANSRPTTREVTPTEGWNPSRLRSGSQARATPVRGTPAPATARTRRVSATPTPSIISSQAPKRAPPPAALTARIGGTSHAYGKGARQSASNVVATAKQTSFGSALEEILDEEALAGPFTKPNLLANDEEVENDIPNEQPVQQIVRDRGSETHKLPRVKDKGTPLTQAALQVSNENESDYSLDDSNNTSKSLNETFRNEHEAGLAVAEQNRLAGIDQPVIFQHPIRIVLPQLRPPRWYHTLWRSFLAAFTPARHFRAEYPDSEDSGIAGDIFLMIAGYLLVFVPILMAVFWSVPWAQPYVGPAKGIIIHTTKYGYCGISEYMCGSKDVDLPNGTIDAHIFKDVLAKMERTEIKLRNLENAIENQKPERSTVQQVNHFSPNIGAEILQHLTSPTMPTATEGRHGLFRQFFFTPGQLPAINALTPWTEAGQAWCAAASDTGLGLAQLGVRTAHTIMANSVTIEHVPEAATLDIKTAPKELEFWGKVEAHYSALDTFDHICDTDSPGEDFICLGKVKYDIKKRNHVQTSALVNKNVPASTFVIRVVANHGRHYSCLYRVQMHGDVVKRKDEVGV